MVAEAVITLSSWIQGRTAATLDLRRHWQVVCLLCLGKVVQLTGGFAWRSLSPNEPASTPILF